MKILVFFPRQLGSSILSLPALRAINKNFPASQITLAVNEVYAGLLSKLLPEFSLIPLGEVKDIKKLKSTSQLLARQRFDLAILLDDSFAAALLVYLARIPERWGYDRENRGFMLTKKIRVKFTDPPLHLMDYYLSLLQKLGLQIDGAKANLVLAETHVAEARKQLSQAGDFSGKDLIILKPGSSWGLSRVWPLSYQLELIRKLSSLPAQIVLVGSPASQAVCEKIVSGADGHVHNLAGQWPLESMPGLLALARVFVGNDGGLTHLANALGRPVVALYGPTDYRLCGPVLPPVHVFQKPAPCAPCSYKNCPYDHRCLQSISPEEVFQKVVELGSFSI